MIYDPQGNELPDVTVTQPAPGSQIQWESSDRASTDVSRALTPAKVDSILRSANGGSTEQQSSLSIELEEKSWDIFQAIQTRRLAVSGQQWEILPPTGDETPRAKEIAEETEAMLRATPAYGDQFSTFMECFFFDLQSALLPGFAISELVWGKDGGDQLYGCQFIEQRHFTFADSQSPLLVTTDHPSGIELEPGKFIKHYHRARAGARCRGGIIRPLAWLHCFAVNGIKWLMTHIERYGMPFLVAKVGSESYKTERQKLASLVQNFGPAGGGVFTDAVELEMLQAANVTGDVYFKLLEYSGDAITKVVLGQTASSGDSAGMSNGDAQSQVRQDILEADCAGLENTADQVIRPRTGWKYGPDAPVPRLHIKCEPPEDLVAKAELVAKLYDGGLELDADEASESFGMTLTRRVTDAGTGDSRVAPTGAAPSAAFTAEAATMFEADIQAAQDNAAAILSRYLRTNGNREWFGHLQGLIEIVTNAPDEAAFREQALALAADLPALADEMDSTVFEGMLDLLLATETANGQAARAAELRDKE